MPKISRIEKHLFVSRNPWLLIYSIIIHIVVMNNLWLNNVSVVHSEKALKRRKYNKRDSGKYR